MLLYYYLFDITAEKEISTKFDNNLKLFKLSKHYFNSHSAKCIHQLKFMNELETLWPSSYFCLTNIETKIIQFSDILKQIAKT